MLPFTPHTFCSNGGCFGHHPGLEPRDLAGVYLRNILVYRVLTLILRQATTQSTVYSLFQPDTDGTRISKC